MKIAYIGLRGVPANYSGIEKAVEEIGSRLSASHSITVYCMTSRYKDKLPFYKGITLKYVPNLPGKNIEMISYTFLSTLIACFSKAEIIHFQAIGPSSFALLARLLGKKVVSTNHGLDWRRSKWGKLAKSYLQFGEYVSAKFTHKTISVSKHIQDYYFKKYGSEVLYIPNGKDKKIEPETACLERYGLEKDKYILFVGRVTQEKGIQYLCRAFINSNTLFNKPMKLVIVGDSIDAFRYELEGEFGTNKNIIFTGPIYNRAEIAGLYSNANLFILPSEIEGQSIAILEALSYNCKILASDIPENVSLLDKFGVYFASTDVNDLGIKMVATVNNLNKMCAKDVADYLDSYDWDKIAAQTEQIYLNI